MRRPRVFCNERCEPFLLADKRGALDHGPLGPWVNLSLTTCTSSNPTAAVAAPAPTLTNATTRATATASALATSLTTVINH